MRKKESVFRFKQFSVRHDRSSMKIGVDAVLLGAWADISGARRILDVGTGCGVIALMCAQRNPEAAITGIDIDVKSVEEASENFKASPWSGRLNAEEIDFTLLSQDKYGVFDCILSNPPYFDSGVEHPESSRLKARHQDILSPEVLIIKSLDLLVDNGIVALVMPSSDEETVLTGLKGKEIRLKRRLLVRGHPNAPVKRVLLEFMKERGASFAYDGNIEANDVMTETITLEDPIGTATEDYRKLEKEFYLKF